jgi:hypothetical protein
MEDGKKNIQCDICKGIGLIKNHNFYCIKCDSHKCEFTNYLTKDEFYKYKFCEFCETHNPSNSSPKTHCDKCLGEGFYINEGVKCNNCKIPHSICNCIINPYSECPKCYGSGTIE